MPIPRAFKLLLVTLILILEVCFLFLAAILVSSSQAALSHPQWLVSSRSFYGLLLLLIVRLLWLEFKGLIAMDGRPEQ